MISTGWTAATTDVNEAMLSLLSCIQAGYDAWIEIRENGDQKYPVMIPNPELDDPFNWTSAYGMPRNPKEMESQHYLNETSRDLTYNWTAAYGTPEAAEEYKKTRKVTPDLFSGMGTCCPVRIEDANRYRETVDGYKYGFWVNIWKPKEGFPLYVPDKSIGKVFVICYETDTEAVPDKDEQLRRAGEFLKAYAGCNAAGGNGSPKLQEGSGKPEASSPVAATAQDGGTYPSEILGEKHLSLAIGAKRKGFNVTLYDDQTGDRQTISCDDLGNAQDIKPCHLGILGEIQFWADSIREEAGQ